MAEILIQILGEFLIQVFGEMLVELGLQSVRAPFRRAANPWLAAVGYALLGAFVGGISLWVVPNHLTPVGAWRIANLILMPVVVGVCMALIGQWRARRGERVLRIDKFACGYLFALLFALVRFAWAR